MKRAWCVAMTIALALPAQVAAQPKEQASEERSKFAEAQRVYDERRFDTALGMFQEVVAIAGSPNARLYVARCLRELGRLPEAYEEMSRTLRDATARSEKEARYERTRDAAAAELSAIAPKIGRLTIAVADPPPGLEVRVAGSVIDARRLGEPIALTPGEIDIDASAPGRERVRKRITIGAGASEAVAIALKPLAPGAAIPAPTAPAPAPAPAQGGGVRIAGFIVTGLGVAGLATFVVAGVSADAKYDEVFEACGGKHCVDPSYADEISTGRTLDLIANIGLVAGAAGVLGGGAMILFGGPAAGQASVSASPAGASLAWRGLF